MTTINLSDFSVPSSPSFTNVTVSGDASLGRTYCPNYANVGTGTFVWSNGNNQYLTRSASGSLFLGGSDATTFPTACSGALIVTNTGGSAINVWLGNSTTYSINAGQTSYFWWFKAGIAFGLVAGAQNVTGYTYP